MQVGDRVVIVRKGDLNQGKQGTIYNYLSERMWPWHVMPDNWPDAPGIAYAESEIKPVTVVESASVLAIAEVRS